ncbi:geranylgeranyl diphosphate synthase type II [Tepidibacillus fermentans]|uniref:Farnesyl diphosphate synthase n=2 Tax=Tepidibacillus fermentans TaxID=1281767 RepID=A0A4R3KJT5_9BACI|nr:farnesyl diphosphate synthase [Tepidibacillus fermentans]TCS84041.1 geranylgeranyl diphosphate synthase type II [Tepidibacillus fermentans]
MELEKQGYINQFLTEKAKQINEVITEYLPNNEVPPILKESMEYSLLAGGKRIRPILAMVTYESFGKDGNEIIPIAINLELLHTYSLIHDDLPAMDNDDYRRGKLTNHKVFGEALAILTGDALLTHAFGNMAKYLREFKQLSPDIRLQIIEEFAQYSGAAGMVGGQVLDTLGEQGKSTFEDLIYVHTHKTGDLLVFSIRLGALLAGANETQIAKLTEFGRKIGLAFQIQDDILDVIGDSKKLGKMVGSDQNNRKITYPFFKGIDESKLEVGRLIKEAKQLIQDIGIQTEHLYEIADFMVFRDK